MAKRGKGKAAGGRKGKKAEVELETADGAEAPAENPAGLEQALVMVTFIALITALILSQIELSGSYGKGLL